MTPSHAVKNGTRYRYYVSGSLITKDRTDNAAALRIPAAEIEQLISDRVHRWLLDPGSIEKSTAARLADPSIQCASASKGDPTPARIKGFDFPMRIPVSCGPIGADGDPTMMLIFVDLSECQTKFRRGPISVLNHT